MSLFSHISHAGNKLSCRVGKPDVRPRTPIEPSPQGFSCVLLVAWEHGSMLVVDWTVSRRKSEEDDIWRNME